MDMTLWLPRATTALRQISGFGTDPGCMTADGFYNNFTTFLRDLYEQRRALLVPSL